MAACLCEPGNRAGCVTLTAMHAVRNGPGTVIPVHTKHRREHSMCANHNTPGTTGNEVTRLSESETTDRNRADSAKPVLAFFINQRRSTVATHLQKLVFYAEAIYFRDYGTRLTEVEWKPYMYGMFSHDIREALSDYQENPDVDTTTTLFHGKRTTAYNDAPNPTALSEETAAFLTGIHQETTDTPYEDLVQWSKNHPLFDSTPYDHVVQFE